MAVLVFTQVACERRTMRGVVAACLLITCLQRVAVADPVATPAPAASSYDPDATARDNSGTPTNSPWLDLAPAKVLSIRPARDRSKLYSALTVGAIHAGFIGWTYFAWYQKETHAFRAGGDGLFSPNTYAGGADKMGHAWATLGA